MQLICVFVFAYAKSRLSHDAAHIICLFCLNPKFQAPMLYQWLLRSVYVYYVAHYCKDRTGEPKLTQI